MGLRGSLDYCIRVIQFSNICGAELCKPSKIIALTWRHEQLQLESEAFKVRGFEHNSTTNIFHQKLVSDATFGI